MLSGIDFAIKASVYFHNSFVCSCMFAAINYISCTREAAFWVWVS
jgi:hypothetical protein